MGGKIADASEKGFKSRINLVEVFSCFDRTTENLFMLELMRKLV